MKSVVLEARPYESKPWTVVGEVTDFLPAGSISTFEPEKRFYMFGWVQDEGPKVWRSDKGEEMEGLLRSVGLDELQPLADLEDGPYEMIWNHPDLGKLFVRFRLKELVDS